MLENAGVPAHYRSPESLLRELGIDAPEDIRIEAIAQHCGATVLYEPLEGSDARIIGFNHRAFITVNSGTTVARQRFSAAHELGHWMWDRGRTAFACGQSQPESVSEDDPERRANRYATDLLLPAGMFTRRMEEQALGFANVQRLAQDFQTSVTATAIRLVELTSSPAILISSERSRRRWYFRGPRVPRALKPGPSVPPGSIAHRIISGETVEPGPQAVEASLWIDPGIARGEVREDSISLGGDYYLTILWWPEGASLPTEAGA